MKMFQLNSVSAVQDCYNTNRPTNWPNKCLSNWPSAWSRFLFQNLRVAQLLKKSDEFYRIWKFSTVFTTAWHWTLYRARTIQSTAASLPISSRNSNTNSICPFFVLPSYCVPLIAIFANSVAQNKAICWTWKTVF
jgi:hypothetical protein